jgi:hypothetical protein
MSVEGYGVISILFISLPKVIYAELFHVKDIPHFFPNLFQNHSVYLRNKGDSKILCGTPHFNLYSAGEDFLSSVNSTLQFKKVTFPLYVFVFFKRSTTSSIYCNIQSFNFLLIQRIMSILYLTRQLIIIYYALRSKNTYFSAWTCPLPFPSTLWVDSVDSCKALHYSPN